MGAARRRRLRDLLRYLLLSPALLLASAPVSCSTCSAVGAGRLCSTRSTPLAAPDLNAASTAASAIARADCWVVQPSASAQLDPARGTPSLSGRVAEVDGSALSWRRLGREGRSPPALPPASKPPRAG